MAAVQLAVVENHAETTFEKAEKAIRSCPDADLVILPEIWPTGFLSFDRYETDAQPQDGPGHLSGSCLPKTVSESGHARLDSLLKGSKIQSL